MRIIGETNIPFLSYRRIAIVISLLVILSGLAYEFLGPGLNLGIDFVGGTQVTLKFNQAPDLGELRDSIAGLEVGTPVIQGFDESEKHEVLIRVENPEGEEGDFTRPIIDLLQKDFNANLGSAFDLNTNGALELVEILVTADPDNVAADPEGLEAYYGPMAEAVLDFRKKNGIFTSLDDLAEIEAVTPEVRAFLEDTAAVGAFSLVGMLVYIWIRFQLPYAVGAVAALFHDVLITLAAIAVTGREINLPTVAAMLTLVGYSVNDTVVVFDRVRENLRLRRGEELEGLMNVSINQTLSRTLITSGTTLVVVLSLYIFGGDVINTFAFVLLVGIIVGTYSSIFIASPVALAINRLLVARRERRRAAGRR